MWLPDLAEVGLGAADLGATVDAIAAWQLPSGMIPWFPGGHADPWNHTEAAMALLVGGRRAEAERAYDWLASRQRPDGAWHRYELADGVEEDKLDANVCAYPATGLWHHWLCVADRGFLEAHWAMLDRAIHFVLGLQTPRGEILWARHADGTPWPYALLTGSSSISLSLRCALGVAGVLGQERPEWELALARLAHTLEHVPDAFAPKHRWAMDWYYPALVGALPEAVARERLDAGWDRFVLGEVGVRCVVDRDWVTAAETCECALAFLRAGERGRASDLLRWTSRLRDASGHYFTGLALPEDVHFPEEERTTYTGAAVVLCADALAGASPAAGLFVDASVVPAAVGLDEAAARGEEVDVPQAQAARGV
ncbi:MAG: prenyltransferase [Acidimicrobiia bacterium]|nr:prenyltransferase [Acidimicrobiia bacterium]